MPQREPQYMSIDIHTGINPCTKVVSDVGAAARYIGNYLNMQSYRMHRYIMSAGWLFKGSMSWSKWFRKYYGVYPYQVYPGVLEQLLCMSKSEHDEIAIPELMKIEGLR